MNVVMILVDSLNKGYLEPYGCTDVATPNIARFAERATRFDNHFVGSLPCMPARREIFAGRRDFLWRPWGPLEPFDTRLPESAREAGYASSIITDHFHYWSDRAHGYIQSFASSELVRGHEIDRWRPPAPEDEDMPDWAQAMARWRPEVTRQYYANVKRHKTEDDFFVAQVMRAAASWLDRHASERPFFLQVESFDVHEPFHVPEPYRSMYAEPESLSSAFTTWPPYQDPGEMKEFFSTASRQEIEFIRSQYMGKVTMVDRWLGELLDTMDRLDLWSDTVMILTTDHGHDLGERNTFGKQFPHHDSHANIPLLIWHPQYRTDDCQTSALTTTVDLHATIIDVLGLSSHSTHGRSLIPLLQNEESHREGVIYGTFNQGICVTDGEWTLLGAPRSNTPANLYSSIFPTPRNFLMMPNQGFIPNSAEDLAVGTYIPGVDLPQWRMRVGASAYSWQDELYNRVEDPHMTRNLVDSETEQTRRLLRLAGELAAAEGAPPEQFDRLGLR